MSMKSNNDMCLPSFYPTVLIVIETTSSNNTVISGNKLLTNSTTMEDTQNSHGWMESVQAAHGTLKKNDDKQLFFITGQSIAVVEPEMKEPIRWNGVLETFRAVIEGCLRQTFILWMVLTPSASKTSRLLCSGHFLHKHIVSSFSPPLTALIDCYFLFDSHHTVFFFGPSCLAMI